MNVVDILSSHNVGFISGERLGEGADGEVFDLKNGKVIKYSILYDDYVSDLESKFLNIKKNLLNLIDNSNQLFCNVYEFREIIRSSRVCQGVKQDYIIYSYVMEKMDLLYGDEQKVLFSVLNNKKMDLHVLLGGLSFGLYFDKPKVVKFYELLQSGHGHKDIHIQNIMKDCNGNFKLIDFDRMV